MLHKITKNNKNNLNDVFNNNMSALSYSSIFSYCLFNTTKDKFVINEFMLNNEKIKRQTIDITSNVKKNIYIIFDIATKQYEKVENPLVLQDNNKLALYKIIHHVNNIEVEDLRSSLLNNLLFKTQSSSSNNYEGSDTTQIVQTVDLSEVNQKINNLDTKTQQLNSKVEDLNNNYLITKNAVATMQSQIQRIDEQARKLESQYGDETEVYLLNGSYTGSIRTSHLKSDFKMFEIEPHRSFLYPVVKAQLITSGIVANPAFYVEIKNNNIYVHTTTANYDSFFANNKVSIQVTINEDWKKYEEVHSG